MTVALQYMKAGVMIRGWTEVEDARLIEWTVAGQPLTLIAKALGRTESAVAQRRNLLRKRIEGAREVAEGARAVWPVPAGVPVPDPARASGAIRARLQARLADLPRGKFWTVARDLALAQAMAAGGKAADLARDWRCEAGDVQARWLVLCPDRAQVGVVAELIAILGEEVTHG